MRGDAVSADCRGGFRLTGLGMYSPYPPRGGSCPAYLLETRRTMILLECGSGAVSRLMSSSGRLPEIDALFLSHLHGDHFSDLLVLRYYIHKALLLGWRREPLTVYAPDSPSELASLIPYRNSVKHVPLRGAGHEALARGKAQTRIPDSPPAPVKVGDILVSFEWASHPIPTLAMRFESESLVLAYSADSEASPAIARIARDADVFLAEATFLEGEVQSEQTAAGHMTALRAAKTAHQSGARRLILTHVPPDADPAKLLDEAKPAFSEVELASEGRSYSIP